jgi:dynein intermediate chain 1
VEQLAIHFQMDGNLIPKDSDDAKKQGAKKEEADYQDAQAAAAAGDDDDEKGGKPKEKKITNQFNFSERASQTFNNPARERSTMTEPPPRLTYSSNATQWEIYDAYVEDFEAQVFIKFLLFLIKVHVLFNY